MVIVKVPARSLSVASAIAIADASARQVVWAHFDPHAVAEQNADAESAHLAAGIGQQLVAVVETDGELRVAQCVDHRAVHLERVPLGHQASPLMSTIARSASVSSRLARRYARKASGDGWSLAIRSASSRNWRRSWTNDSSERASWTATRRRAPASSAACSRVLSGAAPRGGR